MNRFLNKIFFVAIAALGLFAALPAMAQTPPNLSVTFDPNPLFQRVDFAPGQSVSGTVTVANNTGEARKIAVEAIKQEDGGLASQLQMAIRSGGAEIYNKTLREFFDAGQIYLSEAAPDQPVEYVFTVSFNNDADNSYKEKTAGFDLMVGFLGEEGGNTPPTDPGGSTGTSGGGGSLPQGLTIYENQIIVAVTGQTSAVINWQTSYNSTSQVVYAAEGESYSFAINPSTHYGYPHAAPDPENSEMVMGHSVTLTGLSPGVTYYFRVISHASPPTVSYEHSFTTWPEGLAAPGGALEGEVAGAQTDFGDSPENPNKAAGPTQNALTAKDQQGMVLGQDTTTLVTVKQATNGGQACRPVKLWPLGYLVYALFLAGTVWMRKRSPRKQWSSYAFVLLAAAVLWWLMEPCNPHLWYWLALILILFLSAWRFLLPASPQPPLQ